jgi:hypothetical protein
MDTHILELSDIGGYLDDSVSMLKLKLQNYLGAKTSADEIYICIETSEYINVHILYTLLSLQRKVPITYQTIRGFCQNIKEPINIPKNISVFTLADLSRLFDPAKKYTMFRPVGFKIALYTNLLITEYVMLPARISLTNPEGLISAKMFMLTEHNEDTLIQSIAEINETTDIKLHVYVLGEILSTGVEIPNISDILKIYYPKILARIGNINGVAYPTIVSRIKNVQGILTYNTNKMYEKNKAYLSNITAFHNIPIEPPATMEGIINMGILVNNSIDTIFPTQYIFKTIHATELFPCIKYCKNRKSEQLFRLYQQNNIPVTSKSMVAKLMNTVGKIPGITALVSMNKYAYLNNIDINLVSDMVVILHLHTNGNINVYYETSTKNMIPTPDLLDLIRSIMGFFSEVVNSTIPTYPYKLPVEYHMLTGIEVTVISLKMAMIYSTIKLSAILQKSQYLPAVFSVMSSGRPAGDLSTTLDPFIMIYTRTNTYTSESLDSTYVSVLPDKITRGVSFTIHNIPSLLYVPLIRSNISKLVGLLTTKDIFANYKVTCVPGYNVYISTTSSQTETTHEGDDIPDNTIGHTLIPISTMYNALDTSSEGADDAESMERVLRTIEDMILVRKEETETARLAQDQTNGTEKVSTMLSDPDMEEEYADLQMELGDLGW